MESRIVRIVLNHHEFWLLQSVVMVLLPGHMLQMHSELQIQQLFGIDLTSKTYQEKFFAL